MKKLVFVASAVIFLLAACGAPDLSDDEAKAYIDKGQEIVKLINQGEYEEVHAMFDEDMEDELTVEDMEDLTPILEEAGTFEEIEKTSLEERDGKYGIVLVTKYSEKEVIFAVTLDDEMEVAGLLVQ